MGGNKAGIESVAVPEDLHLFAEEWVEEPVAMAEPRPTFRCAVVFVSGTGAESAIRQRFAAEWPGLTVVTVAQGDGFRRLAGDRYTAGGATYAELEESFGAVLSVVAAEHGQVDLLVHLWAAEDRALLWEPEPLAVLVQTMMRQDVSPGRVVLGGIYHDEAERCAVESWLGYERSIGIVLPGTTLTALCVEATRSPDVEPHEALADVVAGELLTARPSGARHTGGRRYVPRMATADKPATVGPVGTDLRHGGTYLITGGLGGLGDIFARWLARDYGARLVLIGRREPDDTVSTRIAELEAAGATVLYRSADVRDEAALTAAVEAAVERFGRIDGVLHAAGVQRRGNIADRDLATFAEILGPKVTGTLNLERALSGVTPDFVCYFSSSAAVLGDFGSCDYACGNRFLVSHARRMSTEDSSGPRRLAVCWPLWRSDGMGLGDDATTEFYVRSSGQRLLQADEGTALLRELLARPGEHYLVLAGEAPRIHAMLEVDEPMPSVAQSLDRVLSEIVSRILRIPVDRLPVDEKFQDFGFDSLSLVEFAGVVGERLGVEITPDVFFSYTTLRSLGGHLLDRHEERLASVLGSPAAEPADVPVGPAPWSGGAGDSSGRVRRRTRRAEGNRFAGAPPVTEGAPSMPRQTAESDTCPEPAAETGETVAARLDGVLSEIVSRILRIPVDRLPVDEKFQDFGFDSLSLVEFAGVVGERLGVEITPDVFFSYTTLRSLGGHLLDRHEERLASVLGSPAAAVPMASAPAAPIAPAASSSPAAAPVAAMGAAASRVRRRTGPAERSRLATTHSFVPAASGPATLGAADPVAIIGMSGQFASARTVGDLWKLLCEGRSAIGTVPADRDPSWADGKDRTMAWLPGIAQFDPRFFGIAPSDAETIDPRQRLLLEEMWKALEDAGLGAEQLAGQRVGVFVGVEEGDYRLLAADQEAITANHNAVLAARLSYFLNLTGPGLAINTACSSSLVALHEACLSLRHGDCDIAIVAGANLMATPREYDAMDSAGMLSPSGACRAFDRRADGMVPGEAAVAVVLTASDRAERDGHPVHARVIGTAINNDGHTNGITAPSGLAQTRLLTDVLQRAGVSPAEMGHIVAHGTGTRLGDPVEINALAETFGPHVAAPGTCALTSTKPNIGHSQASSGLASVVAMALAMKHETIPPSIHCEEISDFVAWERSPFFVNREQRSWPESATERRYGGVSAFGFSGTNAHAVLESHGTARNDVERLGAQPTAQAYLLLCSARTEKALSARLRDLADHLDALGDTGDGVLSSVSYTLIDGRHHFSRRCALVVRDRADAIAALRAAAEGTARAGVVHGTVGRDFAAGEGALVADLVGRPDEAAFIELARSYCAGHDPAPFTGLWPARPPERMHLPTYPFDNADYWVSPVPSPQSSGAGRLHPLVHRNVSDVTGLRFASDFAGTERWFADRADGTRAVTPGAQLELLVAGAAAGFGADWVTLHDVESHDAIVSAGAGCTARIDLRAGDAGGEAALDWALYALENGNGSDDGAGDTDAPYLVADGRARRARGNLAPADVPALRERCATSVELATIPVEAGIVTVSADATEPVDGRAQLLVAVSGDSDGSSQGAGGTVADRIDACLAVVREYTGAADTEVASVGELGLRANASAARWAHLTVTAGAAPGDWSVNADLIADDGLVVANLRRVALARPTPAPEGAEEPAAARAVPPGPGRRVHMRGWSVPECLAWDLADAAGTVLKLPTEALDTEENLANFGFNSLNIASYATELSTRLEFRITPDTFFNHPTLSRLAAHLGAEHGETIAAWYREGSDGRAVTITPARAGRKYHSERLDGSDTGGWAPGGVSAEPVAIVGMSGRFPDARTVDDLWSILAEGRSVIREVPEDRAQWWHTGEPEADRARRFGALPGVAEFDPLFFEVAPREADLMDPRQRLLLQEMWHALEDAGYGDQTTNGEKIGIFVGVEEGDYRYLVNDSGAVTSTNNSVLAARLAYLLNLSGPTMAINTSCSSGLVALHEACLSLRYGDCDTAIVAGASILSSAHDYLTMEKAGMLSPESTCYAFDQRANGMVPGEAVAVVVLKRERAARRDGNRIHATIVGSGINYDGRTNGITAPSGDAQARLLRDVYERFAIAPEDIDYVAAHGTGTRLGDPIEINALADAYRAGTDRTGFCALTSMKPNIGHSMAASGLVNLIGVVMAMRNEIIPPSIHCEERSDYIDWDDSPFFVNREPRPWRASADCPRRGAVSSFGMSGTNAHVVLEAPDRPTVGAGSEQEQRPMPHHLLVVSAKTEEALVRHLADLADHLAARDTGDGGPDTGASYLAAVSRTLMTGRHHFAHRRALVVRDRDDAVRLLRAAAAGGKEPGLYRGSAGREFVANATIEKTIAGIARACATLHDDDTCRDHLRALAEFYCQGHAPAFEGMWTSLPDLVSLPNYPFAPEHHWVPDVAAPARVRSAHPLMHEHTSDGTVHRFRTRFIGGESVLSEALVPAESTRPGPRPVSSP